MFIAVGCARNDTIVKETSKGNNDNIKNLEKKIKTLELDNEQIKDLQEKIKLLEAENNEMKVKMDNIKKEKDNFNELSHLAVEFVNAQVKGDTKKLKEMISEEVEWKYVPYTKDNSDGQYEYMVIQAYEYVPEDDVYKINIKESYAEIPGLQFQFLDLHFKKINNEWKIVYVVLQP